MPFEDLIDFNAVAKLRGLLFRSRKPLRGYSTGIHRSRLRGTSPDFFEYKEYSPGDEFKHLDWRVFGRLDRLYVKKYEDEVNLRWCVLLDRSGSMGYGSRGASKLEFALRLSATFSYLLLKQGDTVSMGSFSERELRVLPPATSVPRLLSVVQSLASLGAEGRSGFLEPLTRALEGAGEGAYFVLVSDFLGDLESIERAVRLVRSMKKELIALHVLDPEELDFSFHGPVEFEDLEEGLRVRVNAEDAREAYRERMEGHRSGLMEILQENGARYVLSLTNSQIEDLLVEVALR